MTSSQIGEQLGITSLDPISSPAWAHFIETAPSTVFHTPRWMKVLRDTYNFPIQACVLERDGRAVAGVPWCHVDDVLGVRRVTLAFSDYCDLLAAEPHHVQALAGVLLATGEPWILRSRDRHLPRLPLPAQEVTAFKSSAIALAEDEEGLWAQLNSTAQRGVRKAERSEVRVVPAETREDLRRWFLLHLRLRKHKHGLLAQPYAFFERIWEHFIEAGQGFLLLAMHEGRLIGGTLYLLWKDTCYYKFNASEPEALNLRPNNALLWHGMLEARRRGARCLDLGRSGARQEGLLRFKSSFGATEEDAWSVTYHIPHGAPTQDRNPKQLLRDMTALFVDRSVPDHVTEAAGDLLYRFFT